MKDLIVVGHIGVDKPELLSIIKSDLGCSDSDILMIESLEDIPKLHFEEMKEKTFEISAIPILPEPYIYDSFHKKKKQKNEEWQSRMRNLQRRRT